MNKLRIEKCERAIKDNEKKPHALDHLNVHANRSQQSNPVLKITYYSIYSRKKVSWAHT